MKMINIILCGVLTIFSLMIEDKLVHALTKTGYFEVEVYAQNADGTPEPMIPIKVDVHRVSDNAVIDTFYHTVPETVLHKVFITLSAPDNEMRTESYFVKAYSAGGGESGPSNDKAEAVLWGEDKNGLKPPVIKSDVVWED